VDPELLPPEGVPFCISVTTHRYGISQAVVREMRMRMRMISKPVLKHVKFLSHQILCGNNPQSVDEIYKPHSPKEMKKSCTL